MQTTFLRDETSYVPNTFNSLENRQILLNIMRDIGLFDDINEGYITFIKNDLDEKVNHIFDTKNNSDTTVKMNKRVISEMMTEINKYKNNSSTTKPEQSRPEQTRVEQRSSSDEESLITSSDIKKHKLEVFEKDVSKTWDDFNKFNKKKNPDQIDFTIDVNEKPDTSQMVDLYNKAILLRNQDLNLEIPVDTKVKGSKWINRELPDSYEIENIQNRNIKISKDDAMMIDVIKVKNEEVINNEVYNNEVYNNAVINKVNEPKRVTFSNEPSDEFLLKMKQKYIKNKESVLAKPTLAEPVLAKPTIAKPTIVQPTIGKLVQPILAKQELAKQELVQPILTKPVLAKQELANQELVQPILAKQVLAKPMLAKQELEPTFEEYIKTQLQIIIENQNQILSMLKN